MEEQMIEDVFTSLDTYASALQIALVTVIGLLIVCALVSLVVSIYLAISYHRYNRKQNSVNMAGRDIARKLLDESGLDHIQVKCSGSLLFGNSYSHYFKKVRLRRRTWKKASVSSMAMAVQKSCLAIMDKERDPDMVKRIRLTPVVYMGPLACIPLIIVGIILDMLMAANGVIAVFATVLGLGFYVLSFVMALLVLKTEVKAQNMAYRVAREHGIATEEEIEDMHKLFRLYNIEYINNMVTAMLELILRILMALVRSKSSSSGSSKD